MNWPRSQYRIPMIPAIRTDLARYFGLTIDFPGLCRNGSSSQPIDQTRVVLEQRHWDCNLSQLESNITTITTITTIANDWPDPRCLIHL